MLKSAPGRYVATNMHTNVMMVPYKPSYPTICTQTTVQLSSLRIIMQYPCQRLRDQTCSWAAERQRRDQ